MKDQSEPTASKLEALISRASDLPVRLQSPWIDRMLRLSGSLPRGKSAIPRHLGQLLLRGSLYETQMRDGCLVLWDPRVTDVLVSTYRSGMWDNHVLQALLAEMQDDTCFYDVGANVGLLTLAISKAYPTAEIFAFEPLPALANALTSAIARNGMQRTTVIEAALSDVTGPITLHLPAHAIHASLKPRGRSQHLTVRGETLDRLCAAGLPPPNLIKIDVEGAEMLLFEGARNTLSRYRPTLIFECDQNSKRFGHNPSQAIALLASFGYTKFERLCTSGTRQLMEGSMLSHVAGGDFVAKA